LSRWRNSLYQLVSVHGVNNATQTGILYIQQSH
jgi:hypothetical protein